MKKKFSKILGVGLALALVLSLVVMAVPVLAAHDVIVSSDVAGSTPGDSKTITVTVENTGGAEAIDLVVIDIPPVGTDGSTWDVTEFATGVPTGWSVTVAADGFGLVDTLTYTGDTDTIPDGESDDFTFTAVAPPWAGDYVFTVTTTDTIPVDVTSDFTIVVDGTSPVLSSIAWTDVDTSTDFSDEDTLLFTFSEEIASGTIAAATLDVDLPLSSGSWGTVANGLAVSALPSTTLTVTLGSDFTFVSGVTVNPADTVTDVAGNPDATVPAGGPPLTLPTILDDEKPYLDTIAWSDVDGSTDINVGDTLLFTFSEAMNTSTVAVGTLGSRLPLSAGSYGDGATIAWATDGKSLTVTLGTAVNILSAATVNPDPLVTDVAGNADDTVTPPDILDNVGPILLSITWDDVDSSAAVNPGDSLVFIFSEKMDTTTIDHASIGTVLATEPAHNYGSLTSENVTWNIPDNYILTVTLGTGTTIQPNDTVDPDDAVTDIASVADATEAPGPPIAQVTVSVDAPTTVVKGQSFVATLNITDVTALDAASYNVMFDSTILELTSVTAGTVGTTAIPVGATTDILDVDLVVGVRVVQNVGGTEGVSGSGTLAELNFTFIGNSGENSTIDLAVTMLSDKDANEIYANWFGDSVAATALVGDANGDGSLNALDITYIERCVSGDTNYPETGGADANVDSNIDALDITKVEILVGEA